MPQENDKSPNTVQFPLPLRLKKKTQHGQMTHQTKACKPQKTKKMEKWWSIALQWYPGFTVGLSFTCSKGDREDMVLLMRHCVQKGRHIVSKIHEKNDRARGGSRPSVIVCIWKYLARQT